jgi:uncharacterized membrane protein
MDNQAKIFTEQAANEPLVSSSTITSSGDAKTRSASSQTLQICRAGCFAAVVFVVTRFIQIPIPLGYFNIGNCVILTGCLFFEAPYGIAAGAIGSALADLLSYPAYTVPTLLIKTLMPLVFYLICGQNRKHKTLQTLLAAYICTLIPLFGYTITGGILYGSLYTGLAQFPGLLLEYIANAILFTAACHVVGTVKKVVK